MKEELQVPPTVDAYDRGYSAGCEACARRMEDLAQLATAAGNAEGGDLLRKIASDLRDCGDLAHALGMLRRVRPPEPPAGEP